jgi:hypothetical protein
MRYTLHITLCVLLAFIVVGCSSDDPLGPADGQGRITIYLADAPADIYSEVNVEIERVEIYSEQTGWTEIRGEAEVYNLLDLTNGNMAVLADVIVEADTYTRVRIHLGSKSNLVIGGSMVNISLSAGYQGGYELEHQIEMESGTTAEILLDFDAHRSVSGSVVTGFVLQPVIRIQAMDQAGNIRGRVVPIEAKAVVIASQNGEVITSTYANKTSGEFKLVGLAQGEYNIEVVARAGNYEAENEINVSVEARQTTELGTIELEANGE